MKKILLFSLFSAAAFGPLTAQATFRIEGEIDGLSDRTMIVLMKQTEDKSYQPADTAYVREGVFSFEVGLTERDRSVLIGGNRIDVLGIREVFALPDSTVYLRGTDRAANGWEVLSNDSLQIRKDRFDRDNRETLTRQTLLSAEMGVVRSRLKKTEDSWELDSLEAVRADLSERMKALEEEIFVRRLRVLESTERDPEWMDMLYNLSYYVQEVERLAPYKENLYYQFSLLSGEEKNSVRGREIRAGLFPPDRLSVGDRFRDTVLLDPEGLPHRLSDYNDKYILLVFWHYQCGVIPLAMPEIREVIDAYSDRLKVIGINLEKDREYWAAESRKKNKGFLNLHNAGFTEYPVSYGVDGVPYFVFIAPGGRILDSTFGYRPNQLKELAAKHLEKME